MNRKYRGAAHNICNLKFKKPMILPVIFHNLSGYDSHLFIKQLAACRPDNDKFKEEIDCIANNEEKYISFSKEVVFDTLKNIKTKNGKEKEIPLKFELRFIDSFKFTPSSLSSLVENMKKEDLKSTKECFPKENEFNILIRKGVYPYD